MKMTLTREKSLLFILFISLVVISGCSKYQYVSIGSRLNLNEASEYVIENDTAIIPGIVIIGRQVDMSVVTSDGFIEVVQQVVAIT